jgi:hypothetical protein
MLKRNDRVRLVEDVRTLQYGDRAFKIGEIGTLSKMYRMHGNTEIWRLTLDSGYSIAVAHTQIEKLP